MSERCDQRETCELYDPNKMLCNSLFYLNCETRYTNMVDSEDDFEGIDGFYDELSKGNIEVLLGGSE